jgi:cyanophycin synthetase
VAGRFDHYICRRDDSLRGRAPDEVPKLIAATLLESGVPEAAITLIPDEQEAIDAGLRMAQQGDLLLVFADALVRSWKQVIKFRPEGASAAPAPRAPVRPVEEATTTSEPAFVPEQWEGVSRDERGIFISRESDD